MKDVAALSEGKVSMGTGTLYGALSRLLEQSLIERIDLPEDNDNDGRLRKAYRLTSTGRSLLQVETDRMRALVATASLRLEEGNI